MLRVLAIGIVLMTIPARLPAQVGADDRVERASVTVVAFDLSGDLLPPPQVRLFEDGDGRDFAREFRDGKAEGIPFGTYRMVGFRQGFGAASRYVRVYARSATVVLGLPLGSELPRIPNRLAGRVVGLSRPEPGLIVRVVGVYSGESIETKADPDGRFQITALPQAGSFLFLVIDERRVLAIKLVQLPLSAGGLVEVGIGEGVPPSVDAGRDGGVR